MKTAAFTIFQNNTVILGLWLKYYTQWFDDIFVIANGTRNPHEGLDALMKEYKFKYKRIALLGNSTLTLGVVSEVQKGLFSNHEWVLYSDCDEFVTPDLEMYKDFFAFFKSYPHEKVLCEAFDILQVEGEGPIDYTKPYLMQRKYWCKDISYNKPLLSKVPLNWAEGCHRELEVVDTIGKQATKTGIYLIHIKYADLNPTIPKEVGPITTQIETRIVVEGLKIKEEIPEKIKKLF